MFINDDGFCNFIPLNAFTNYLQQSISPIVLLLYGLPSTWKKLLACGVAHHTDCTFIRISFSELVVVQKYIVECHSHSQARPFSQPMAKAILG